MPVLHACVDHRDGLRHRLNRYFGQVFNEYLALFFAYLEVAVVRIQHVLHLVLIDLIQAEVDAPVE